MRKLTKIPIINDNKEIVGYEAPEKQIKILVCNKKDADEVREFDRMYLTDEMSKYSETITLSLLHHFLRKVYPNIKYIISYADTSVGNKGTIYKAANYKLIDKRKADFYILESDERVHPVTMWHRHGTRKWDFLIKQYPNIRKADGFQLKYLFEL